MPMFFPRTAALAAFALILAAGGTKHALSATEQAGVSAAVRGQVQRASDAQPVGVQIESGQPIYLADRISSGAASGMQIMLLDQTTFTIGPDSFVKIDEFVYDPTTNVGKVTASLGKGVFRFVSGKIAQENPSNMTVKLPTATIGIRGTMVYGRSDENSAVVGLAGAGPDNNTGDKAAGIDVITPQGTAEIRRPGWGVIIERGKPLIVGRLPKPMVDSIYDSVAPRELANALSVPGNGAIVQAANIVSVRTANNTSGQSKASAAPSANTYQNTQGRIQPVRNTAGPGTINSNSVDSPNGSSSGGQVLSGEDAFSELEALIASFDFDTISTVGDLKSVVSGTGQFTENNVPIYNLINFTRARLQIIGSYNFSMTLNFDAQIAQASFNNINVNGAGVSISNATVFGSVNYSEQTSTNPFVFNSSGSCGNASCQGFVVMNNAGGTIAKNAFHELLVTNANSTLVAAGLGVTSR